MSYQDLLTSKQNKRYGDLMFEDDEKQCVYSTGQKDNALLMGIKWNKYISRITDPDRKVGMAYVFNTRMLALKKVVEDFGVYGIFHYFKIQWPHLFRINFCKITCKRLNGKGACDEAQKEECFKKLIAVLKKLSFPRMNFSAVLSGEKFFHNEPEQCIKRDFVIVSIGSSRSAAIEKKTVNCAFHEGKEMVLKLKYSKKPICSRCRGRSAAIVVETMGADGEELEKRVIAHLEKQAQNEKK